MVQGLTAWGDGLPWFIRVLAEEIAADSDVLAGLLKRLEGGELKDAPLRTGVPTWLRFYDQPMHLWAKLTSQMAGGDSELYFFTKFFVLKVIEAIRDPEEALANHSEWTQEERKALAEIQKSWAALAREFLLEHGKEMRKVIKHGKPKFEGLRDDLPHEVWFLYRVWLPCLLVQGEMPHRLLARARAGDCEALRVLLQIDKTLLADARVGETLARLSVERPRAFNIAMKAAAKPMLLPDSIKTRDRLAALLRLISDPFASIDGVRRMTAGEMLSLYRSLDKGDLRFLKWKESKATKDAYRNRVNSEAKHWERLFEGCVEKSRSEIPPRGPTNRG